MQTMTVTYWWRSGISFDMMKEWYDGYTLKSRDACYSIYNANSVMQAVENGEFRSYWRKTAASNLLVKYINMDFDGLGSSAEKLLAGLEIPVRTSSFDNDIRSFTSADDVLTLLMVEMDAEYVADAIQKLHMQENSMKYYNDEQALRAIIKLAYFTYHDHYIKLEELDSGIGYADIVFIPKRYDNYPAMVVELKYASTVKCGIDQIKARNYPEVLRDYGAEILLVCVSYEKSDISKKHTCIIERMESETAGGM